MHIDIYAYVNIYILEGMSTHIRTDDVYGENAVALPDNWVGEWG